ncbi:MAG: rod shape-determining protein MreC [Tissierellia bacterium]|nr:rod shape-determining protein MreC [Tissierellia bacterium]
MKLSRKGKERVLLLIIIVGVIVIGQVILAGKNLAFVESGVGGIISWINRGLSTAYSVIVDGEKTIGDKRSKDALISENEALKAELQQKENIINESQLLKDEENLRNSLKMELVLARVIAKEPGNWFKRITINAGTSKGISVGQTVVTAVEMDNNIVVTGLVGRVNEVGLDWAKINTLMDEETGAGFYSSRTRDGGFIKSALESELNGYMFDTESDIIEGDRLFTSGLGGVYQPEIYLGTVEEVGSDEGGMVKRIIIKPGVDFHKISRVFIIKEN